jgi:hypothetical protein
VFYLKSKFLIILLVVGMVAGASAYSSPESEKLYYDFDGSCPPIDGSGNNGMYEFYCWRCNDETVA